LKGEALFSGEAGCGGSDALFSLRCRCGWSGWCRSGAGLRVVYMAQEFVHGDDITFVLQPLREHSAFLGRDLDIDLVGLEFDDGLAGRNGISDVLSPL